MKITGLFTTFLGLGGLAEAFPNTDQIIISLVLIGVGATLMYLGVSNEKENTDSCSTNGNVLDRLQFLP